MVKELAHDYKYFAQTSIARLHWQQFIIWAAFIRDSLAQPGWLCLVISIISIASWQVKVLCAAKGIIKRNPHHLINFINFAFTPLS
jgi:hypothetical protein